MIDLDNLLDKRNVLLYDHMAEFCFDNGKTVHKIYRNSLLSTLKKIKKNFNLFKTTNVDCIYAHANQVCIDIDH